jgi:hypothetical protein
MDERDRYLRTGAGDRKRRRCFRQPALTLPSGSLCLPTTCYAGGTAILANKLVLPAAPVVRVDSVGNASSHPLPPRLPGYSQWTAPGSAITIFATGVGSTRAIGPYLQTAQPVSVFIDGFYANGVAAFPAQIPGVPGSVYGLSLYVTNLAANQSPLFQLPPQVNVVLVLGTLQSGNPAYSVMRTQPGLALSIKR